MSKEKIYSFSSASLAFKALSFAPISLSSLVHLVWQRLELLLQWERRKFSSFTFWHYTMNAI